VSYLGQKIRETREKQNILLKQVVNHIEVETALIIKAEKKDRNLNRVQVVNFANFFNSSEEKYISIWLCDKLIETFDNVTLATQGIKKALPKIKN
jgi:hypothetical protein